MKYFKFYFVTSIIVGILQIIDGVILASSSDIGVINIAVALLEMLWVIFSIIAIIKVNKSKYVPITYVAYNLLGWCYGAYLSFHALNTEQSIMPLWFAVFGLCFGCYFATVSYLALKQHGVINA